MLTCSDACKSWYKRWKKRHPGQKLSAIPIYPDPPRPPEGSVSESRGQAIGIPEGYVLIEKATHQELLQSQMLVNNLMMTGSIDPSLVQKKSDFVPDLSAFTLPIEKPNVSVAVETPEMIEKRRQLSIKNTLASIDDF